MDAIQYVGEYQEMQETFEQLRNYTRNYGAAEHLIYLLIQKYNSEAQMLDSRNWAIQFDQTLSDKLYLLGDWPKRVQHIGYRSLICRLLEKNPYCPFLLFGLKQILKNGYISELVPDFALDQIPELFMYILQISMKTIMNSRQPLNSEIDKIAKMACFTTDVHYYTKALFSVLDLETNGEDNKTRLRLAFESNDRAFKKKLNTKSLNLSVHHPIASEAIYNMVINDNLDMNRVNMLSEMYTDINPPPKEILKHKDFVILLLEALFTVKAMTIDIVDAHKLTHLLMYDEKPTRDIPGEDAYLQIHHAQAIMFSDLDYQLFQHNLSKCIVYPVIAKGLLQGIIWLSAEPFYFSTDTFERNLYMIEVMISEHPILRKEILEALTYLFYSVPSEMNASDKQLVKYKIIDVLVMLHRIHLHGVLKFMNKYCYHVDGFDIELLKYFITEVLSYVKPQYTERFIDMFIPLVGHPRIPDEMRANNPLILEFYNNCGRNLQ